MDKNNIMIFLVVCAVIYVFFQYFNKKEGLDNTVGSLPFPPPITQGTIETSDNLHQIIQGSPQLTTDDLLPKYDQANTFAKENPVNDLLHSQNFLISGFHSGIDTISQSHKIPYLDLRSCPPINKETVGPWMQSTFEQAPGSGRRPLE